MESLKIVTLNFRGLRDCQKRKQVYKVVREKKADIILLQETHSYQNTDKLWEMEWGGRYFSSNGETNIRGVITLFRRGLKIETVKDQMCRFFLLQVKVAIQKIIIRNIYAPNNDDPEFFAKIVKDINEQDCANIILGGDINLVMNTEIDRLGVSSSNTNNKNALEVVNSYAEEVGLVDVWRVRNPEKRRSWHRYHERITHMALADLGGRAGRTPPPMGPNSFIFANIFTEKCPCQRSTPPLMGAHPPYGKSWICHCMCKLS